MYTLYICNPVNIHSAHTHLHTHPYTHPYTHTQIYMCLCVWVCVRVYKHVCVCVRERERVCVWGVCVRCVCGVCVWGVCVWGVCVGCVCGVCVCGVCVWGVCEMYVCKYMCWNSKIFNCNNSTISKEVLFCFCKTKMNLFQSCDWVENVLNPLNTAELIQLTNKLKKLIELNMNKFRRGEATVSYFWCQFNPRNRTLSLSLLPPTTAGLKGPTITEKCTKNFIFISFYV